MSSFAVEDEDSPALEILPEMVFLLGGAAGVS